jgi:hypothetical protein
LERVGHVSVEGGVARVERERDLAEGARGGFGTLGGSGWLATLSSATARSGGSAFPLFAARRRIPAHAFGLKKNFGRTRGSKMADNEDATASLGYSESLRVEYSPRQTIPEFIQRGEDRFEVVAPLAAEEPRDVLGKNPRRP